MICIAQNIWLGVIIVVSSFDKRGLNVERGSIGGVCRHSGGTGAGTTAVVFELSASIQLIAFLILGS